MESPEGQLRIAAIIEATTVTGPAKNLIRFCRLARNPPPGETPIDISIVTFARGTGGDSGSNAFVEAAQAAGVEVQVIPERRAFDTSIMAGLREALGRRNPSVIQTHGVKSHFLVRALRLHHTYPWIAFHHGYTTEDLKMRLYNQLDRWSLPAAPQVITVCGPFAREVERAGVDRSRIEVLPNSIEPGMPPPSATVDEFRTRFGIRPEEKVLLSVGRFSSEKGQIDLVAMAEEIGRQRPGVAFRVILAGTGPSRQRVESAARVFGDRFVFTGHVFDVKPLYAAADVFVLPSYSEGSPNVLLESMSAGVPIVATSVGGVPETVADEVSALLVPPGKPEAMAARVLRVLEDEVLAQRLRENARAEVQNRSPEIYRRTLAGIYRRVLSKFH